jgi:uncharacterized protein (TIGR02001 family)
MGAGMSRRLAFLAAAMISAPAAAPAAVPEEEAKGPYRLSFDAEIVSDYRFRGASLSEGEPALQAEALLELDPGFWASVWGSTLSGNDAELQFGVGYSRDILTQLNLELSLNYYAYPSESSSNYFEGTAALSYPIGNVTPKIGVEYAPRQAHLRDEEGVKRDNLYAYLALDLAIATTPVTIGGRIGYETGIFDTRERGGKWDWRIGARAETRWLNFGLAYVDSNGRLIGRRGRNLADETLVATLSKSF